MAERVTLIPSRSMGKPNMRALPLIALSLPLALVGGLGAPLAAAPTTPLEAASLDAEPALASPPCSLSTPLVRIGDGYVQLRWDECPTASGYMLLRGDSPETMAPLVGLAHNGHVDVGVEPGSVYYYAVEADGARSAVVLAAIPSA